MHKMKKIKKKLAFATAIATLTASLSMFSGVTASATVVVDDFRALRWGLDTVVDLDEVPREEITLDMDLVVVRVESSEKIFVVSPDYLPSLEDIGYRSGLNNGRGLSLFDAIKGVYFGMGEKNWTDTQSETFKSITEQAKLGDIIHYHAENGGSAYIGSGYEFWINEEIASEYETNDTFEITGSIFDTPFENVKPYVDGNLTATQLTLADGTDIIIEDRYYSYDDPSIWMLQEGKVIPSSGTAEDEISEPEGTWSSKKMVVVDTTDDAVFVAWNGEAPANDKRGMAFNFYRLDKSSPEVAGIADQLKYGDIVYYRGTGEMVFAGNPLIDDMSFVSGEGELKLSGSVANGYVGGFMSVTDEAGTMYVLLNDTDPDTCYIIESGSDYNTIIDFLVWERDESRTDGSPHKYDWKKKGAFWIRPNEDGDVNSDNQVDSADAATLLEEISLLNVGDTGRLNASENLAADVNGDGTFNAEDAALILSYSAEVGAGMLEGVTLKAYATQ